MPDEVFIPNFSPEQRRATLERLETLHAHAGVPAPAAPQAAAAPELRIIGDRPIPPRPVTAQPVPMIQPLAARPVADFETQQKELDAMEAQSQAVLDAIRQKKQALAEARMLHVELAAGKIVLKKENNVISLTTEEAIQLMNKIAELVK